MKPDKKSGGGVTSRPAASRGLPMSNVAVMLAIASQMLLSPRKRPGHMLYDRLAGDLERDARMQDAPTAVAEYVFARVKPFRGDGV